MALTRKQKKEYIKSGGVRCPYCGSDNISGGFVDIDGATAASQKITCSDCDKVWYDIYTLTNIIEPSKEG